MILLQLQEYKRVLLMPLVRGQNLAVQQRSLGLILGVFNSTSTSENKSNSIGVQGTKSSTNTISSVVYGTSTSQLGKTFPHQVKKLTYSGTQARKEMGLCFNCDELYKPGHRCQNK